MKVAKKYYFRDVVTCIGFFAGVGAVLASVGALLVFWCNNVYFWVGKGAVERMGRDKR